MKMRDLVALLETKPLLRRKDVAIHFGITVRTVDRWCRMGKLPRPVFVCGPMWRPADIDAAERRMDGPTATT
jgi:predicted DNA-binding transcriptional regulator AlpA